MAYCRKEGEPFVDDSFPPTQVDRMPGGRMESLTCFWVHLRVSVCALEGTCILYSVLATAGTQTTSTGPPVWLTLRRPGLRARLPAWSVMFYATCYMLHATYPIRRLAWNPGMPLAVVCPSSALSTPWEHAIWYGPYLYPQIVHAETPPAHTHKLPLHIPSNSP